MKTRYIRKLSFKSEPDYGLIKSKFKQAADSLGITYDGVFDWTDTS